MSPPFVMPEWEQRFWAEYDARQAQREREHRYDLQWQLKKLWRKVAFRDCGCPITHCYADKGRCAFQV